MFDFDIKISQKSKVDRVLLKLPIYFYILFSLISICLFLTIILYGASTFSYIFLFISILSLTYKETWVFDKQDGKSFHTLGLGFVYRKFKFNLNDIELLEQCSFIKGQNSKSEIVSKFSFLNKKYYSIKLHLKNGQDYTLITVSENKKLKLDIILNEVQRITEAKLEK